MSARPPQTLVFGIPPSNPTASTSASTAMNGGIPPLDPQAQYNLTTDTRAALLALAVRADSIKSHLGYLYQCLTHQPLQGVGVSGRESMMNWPAFLKAYQIVHEQIRDFTNTLADPSSAVHLSTSNSNSSTYSTPTDNILTSTFVHPSPAIIDGYMPILPPKNPDILSQMTGLQTQQPPPPTRQPPPPPEIVSSHFQQLHTSHPPPLTKTPYANYLPYKSSLISDLSTFYRSTYSRSPADYGLIPDEELNRMAQAYAEDQSRPEGEKLDKMYENLGDEVERLQERMGKAKGIVDGAWGIGGGWDWKMRVGDLAARESEEEGESGSGSESEEGDEDGQGTADDMKSNSQMEPAKFAGTSSTLAEAAPNKAAPPALVQDEDEDMEIIAIPAPTSSVTTAQAKQNAPPSSLAVPPAISRTQSGSSRGDQNEPINIDDDDDDEVQAIEVPPQQSGSINAPTQAPNSAPISVTSAPGSDGSLFGADDDDDDEEMEEVA